jgi:hypothetical protein
MTMVLVGLVVANCAVAVEVAVMKSMVARRRFLRYPNLAGNSEFRRFGSGERGDQKTRPERPIWVPKEGLLMHKIDEI